MGKFITFGCWNQGRCSDNNNNPVSLVTKKLREKVLENPPDCIIISGDNYYPDKTVTNITETKKDKNKENSKSKKVKKQKFINIPNLKSGFECLPDNVDIYILLGNHDVDNSEAIINDPPSPPITCQILKTEIEIIKTKQKNFINEYTELIMHKIIDNTLILIIDTNIYDEDVLSLECYNFINDKFNNYADIIEYQTQKVINILTEHLIESIKNLIIIGHYPLISNEKNKKISCIDTKVFDLFYNTIYNIKKDYINYYYLCADNHTYQAGIVSIEDGTITEICKSPMCIKQYVVGTGGTKLDDGYIMNSDGNDSKKINNVFVQQIPYNNSEQIFNLKYKIISSIENYGFLECNTTNNELLFKFIKVNHLKFNHLITKSLSLTKKNKLVKQFNSL